MRVFVSGATGATGAIGRPLVHPLDWKPRYPSWRRGFREALG